MKSALEFRPYLPSDKITCLRIFDANCPEFFLPSERSDYLEFLNSEPSQYELCVSEEDVVGAFGLFDRDTQGKNLNWILLEPQSQGLGIGSAIMARVSTLAHTANIKTVYIAASHKSAPFFTKFGALATETIENGWGPGMHRINMELQA